MRDQRPIQYEKGFVEFFKLKFLVDERVLIPRPETEILVEQVIRSEATSVLDVGTGSGCIAISVAKNLPHCKITALDISPDALVVARKNAIANGVLEQIDFIESDLISVIPTRFDSARRAEEDRRVEGSLTQDSNQSNMFRDSSIPLRFARNDIVFDLIVANLPYIPHSRIKELDSSVKDFEPHLALDGGEDGFELYRKLFVQMIQKNIYPLYLLAEIDITQVEIAKNEAERYFPKAKVEIRNDLTKRPRFLVIQF